MQMASMKLENDVDEMKFGNNCCQNNIMGCNMYQQHHVTHHVNDAIDKYYIDEIDHINEKIDMCLKLWFDLMDEILKC